MGSNSPRKLQFYNSETVFDLSLKQTNFLSNPERIDSFSALGFSPDVFRYLTGLARYKTTSEGVDTSVGSLAELDDRVTIDDDSIQFDETFQFEYRIPFWKIEFIDDQTVQPVGGDERSLFYESFQNIKYYFRSIEWVKIFFSLEVFNEFLERGDFEGRRYNLIDDYAETTLMERCEETIQILMEPGQVSNPASGPVRFIKRGRSMTSEPQSPPPVSVAYSDLNLAIDAQVPETFIRLAKERNLEAICDLRFIVDEDYNFLSREFEFGERAPSSRFFTGFEESLLPSGYLFGAIKFLENELNKLRNGEVFILTSELQGFQEKINLLKENIFFGRFDIEPAQREERVFELIRDLYNKFGVSIKNLNNVEFDEAFGELEDEQRRRMVLIDPTVSQNFNFQSLFPFGNRIEITDIPSGEYNLLNYLTNYNLEADIMLNLMNGIVSPDSEIQSKQKTLSITETFTGNPTASRRSLVREFDFKEIFNNLSQPFIFNIFAPFLDPRTAASSNPTQDEIITQLASFNDKFTTPYISGLNLNGYLESGSNSHRDTQFFLELQDIIRTISADNLRVTGFTRLTGLKEFFLSYKNNYFEIFAYKIIKRNTTTNAKQEFFIFNRPEEVVEFFDTQVKPNQEYQYSLSALAFVLENTYRYQTLPPGDFVRNTKVESDTSSGLPFAGLSDFVLGAKIRTRQQPKIIELPLTSENSILTDAPPATPNVDFYPVKGFNDRVKIRLSSMNATEHKMPVVIENGDFPLFQKIRQSQKVKSNEKIRFHSDETPAAFEVFRLDRKPESIRDFARGKRIIRSVTSNDQSTDGTSFMDSIAINVDYYYIFRTLDFHGNISNPTEVFKFTLVDNEGALQPLLVTSSLEEMFGVLGSDGEFRKLKKDTNSKNVRRFIKIRPNAQEISFVRGQFDGKTSKDVSSVIFGRGALPSSVDPSKIESQNNIINQRYMLELKSKKTGKSIFVEFKYVLNDFNIATLGRRTMVPDTVTEQDIQDALARRNEGDPVLSERPTASLMDQALENIRDDQFMTAGERAGTSREVVEEGATEAVAATTSALAGTNPFTSDTPSYEAPIFTDAEFWEAARRASEDRG